MRIQDLTQTQSTSPARVTAAIIWEDSQRPSRAILFETKAVRAGIQRHGAWRQEAAA
jgi:hypothetical protein